MVQRDAGDRPPAQPLEFPSGSDALERDDGDEVLAESVSATSTLPSVPVDGRERALLVGVVLRASSRATVEAHLDELGQLVDTAGGVEVGRLVQERSSPDPATFIGRGKVGELADLVRAQGARLVVFDDDLSGSQVRHLEEAMPEDVKVVDRAGVILDIFALRARSREAQTQVEKAQLSYLVSRLTRRWVHLSRQAGGIGTRGVGETQLETDKRLIRKRIGVLAERLIEIDRERTVQRSRREAMPAVALVGYTNAGKSTLFERLTGTRTLVEDRLFATLDARVRRAELGDGLVATVADTVGFIRKLPHHLVASFRSTLAEAADAEIIVHLVDASHPEWRDHLRVGEEVLESLGVGREKCLVVLNKLDKLGEPVPAMADRPTVGISARRGDGLDLLRARLRDRVLALPGIEVLCFGPEGGALLQRALALEVVLARKYSDDGIELVVRRR
ncbi:MAG TPA: GTPase HflX [Thermoanaerobaculaceae bacterium]|nr:GTPase HflX [Thermoanaerobaculaceae bacterium]